MAGTYGAAGTNPYTIPGIGGILSNEVNAETGVTQVYRGGALTAQKSIGTYNPATGKFTPDANANLTDAEKKALSDPQNIKTIKDKSIDTATKAGSTNAQQLLSPNSASTPQGPDQQAAIPTGKTETVPSIETVELKGKQFRIAPDSGLTYPLNRKSTQDRIKFQAYKILPRTGQSQASSGINLDFRFGQRNYESVDGPVFLAIQAGISDQNSVDWGPDSVNAIESALYNASINLMQTDTGQELGNKVNDLAGQIQGELRRRGGTFGRYLAGQAAGINNVLARTDNIVLNPNLELLFQGPQLRPFSFQFKMSAREKPEAEQVKKIIKYFKYHMATRQETTGLFLKAPNVFKIEYQYGTSTPHPGLNLIKECALTNCSVDYTPLGTYATYEDGTMVAYTLSLQFQELEPVYDTNYTKDQPIGY
jgi:hypothetical protein